MVATRTRGWFAWFLFSGFSCSSRDSGGSFDQEVLSQVVLLAWNQSSDSLPEQSAGYGIAGEQSARLLESASCRRRAEVSVSHLYQEVLFNLGSARAPRFNCPF